MPTGQSESLLAWMQATADAVQDTVADRVSRPNVGESVGLGADGTATLQIDRWAEEVVFEALDAAPVALNVVSEESPALDRQGEHTLLLDPIDGTRNVVRGIPFYSLCMSVGRTNQADVDVALVRHLAQGSEYTAVRGQGARLDGKPIRTRDYTPDNFLVSAVPAWDPELADHFPRGTHWRSMGSSALETCLVASGAMDAFVARTPFLRIIDVSAAALIVEEAGGLVYGSQWEAFEADFDVERRIAFTALGDGASREAFP